MAHDQDRLRVQSEDHRFEIIHVSASEPIARLIMVPAMGISARNYIPCAQALANREIDTYIHEWRGFGSSSLRASKHNNWGYKDLLEDLIASQKAIAKSHDGEPSRPLIIAGHSLGSQLALLVGALLPSRIHGVVCIAGGSPFYRVFPWPMRSALRFMFFAMPMLARWVGHYPGYRLGFAGREARGVMADWANSGKTGRYEPAGVNTNLEDALSAIHTPLLGIRMEDDWFVPPASLAYLMDKCPDAPKTIQIIQSDDMDGISDHYRWMKDTDATTSVISDWIKSIEKEHH